MAKFNPSMFADNNEDITNLQTLFSKMSLRVPDEHLSVLTTENEPDLIDVEEENFGVQLD